MSVTKKRVIHPPRLSARTVRAELSAMGVTLRTDVGTGEFLLYRKGRRDDPWRYCTTDLQDALLTGRHMAQSIGREAEATARLRAGIRDALARPATPLILPARPLDVPAPARDDAGFASLDAAYVRIRECIAIHGVEHTLMAFASVLTWGGPFAERLAIALARYQVISAEVDKEAYNVTKSQK